MLRRSITFNAVSSARLGLVRQSAAPRIAAAASPPLGCGTQRRWQSTEARILTRLSVMETQVKSLDERLGTIEQFQNYRKLVQFSADLEPSPLDVSSVAQHCVDENYSTMIFCHRELPVRLAHMIRQLGKLPHGLNAMNEILKVRTLLRDHFVRLSEATMPVDESSERDFYNLVSKVNEELAELDVFTTVSEGLFHLREMHTKHRRYLLMKRLEAQLVQDPEFIALSESEQRQQRLRHVKQIVDDASDKLFSDGKLQEGLDKFFLSTLHLSFLKSQFLQLQREKYAEKPAHLAFSKEKQPAPDENVVGIIEHGKIDGIVNAAVMVTKDACEEVYGESPVIEIDDKTQHMAMKLLYDKVKYVLTELLKNAVRATMERYAVRNEIDMWELPADAPSVKVKFSYVRPQVARDPTNGNSVQLPGWAVVSIRDKGTGMRRSDLARAMCYSFTTAIDEDGRPAQTRLAGFGYGLPLSRMNAQMFGGDVRINSVEGVGTEAILYLKISPEE